MPNLTLSLSEELKKKMEEFPEINWSAFVKKYIEYKVDRLVWKQEMLKQLEAEKEFDEEALLIGSKIKERVWEKLKKEGW